jgi:hypothetical protein
MRKITMLVWGFTGLIVGAQVVHGEDALESQVAARLDRAGARSHEVGRLDEIAHRNFTYSGILVECFQTDSWLQLLNPLAPAKYGSGEDNILREPASGRVYGWKLLSIRF